MRKSGGRRHQDLAEVPVVVGDAPLEAERPRGRSRRGAPARCAGRAPGSGGSPTRSPDRQHVRRRRSDGAADAPAHAWCRAVSETWPHCGTGHRRRRGTGHRRRRGTRHRRRRGTGTTSPAGPGRSQDPAGAPSTGSVDGEEGPAPTVGRTVNVTSVAPAGRGVGKRQGLGRLLLDPVGGRAEPGAARGRDHGAGAPLGAGPAAQLERGAALRVGGRGGAGHADQRGERHAGGGIAAAGVEAAVELEDRVGRPRGPSRR